MKTIESNNNLISIDDRLLQVSQHTSQVRFGGSMPNLDKHRRLGHKLSESVGNLIHERKIFDYHSALFHTVLEVMKVYFNVLSLSAKTHILFRYETPMLLQKMLGVYEI